MHKVDVDDEVFAIVQQHAEPLIDDFNSALRRLLASRGMASQPTHAADPRSSDVSAANGQIPAGTPRALRQILEVVRSVRSGRDTRISATLRIAKQLGVSRQTVGDKYTRQLGITAPQFDRLLTPERAGELSSLLHSKFPKHKDVIDGVLGESGEGRTPSARANLTDIAARIFGRAHGVELEIPPRGTAPGRLRPDF